MKKMLMTLAFFVSLNVFSQSEQYSFKNLAGTWRTSNGIGLDVEDSNTIYIVYGGQRKLASEVVPDFKTTPATLSLSIKDSGKILMVKGLLLFINENTLQWRIYDRETKPASYQYNSSSDMLFLKRIDKLYN